jgi:hypothetical protein
MFDVSRNVIWLADQLPVYLANSAIDSNDLLSKSGQSLAERGAFACFQRFVV